MEPALSVAVIVPAHNAARTLPACLAAIATLRPAADELIVFVDSSTDATEAIAQEAGARVIVNAEPPKGPAYARNAAAAQARSDLLLFIDADVVVAPAAPRHRSAALCEHQADAASGSDNDDPPTQRATSLYMNLRHHYTHQTGRRDASTFWSGLGLMKRSVFLEHGGYDAARYAYPSIEDIELGVRLKAAGHRIRLVPEAQGAHLKDWRLGEVWRTDVLRRAYPWSCLIVDGETAGSDLNISTLERVRAASALTVLLTLGLLALWPSVASGAILAICVGAYLFLNRHFFGCLAHRVPPGSLIASAGLHFVHHLYATATYGFVLVATRLGMRGRGGQRAASVDHGVTPVVRDGPAEETISLNRQPLVRTAVIAVLLCWPMLLLGRPAYFFDTADYYSGGMKSVAYVADRLHPRATGGPSNPAAAASVPKAADVKLAKSVPYSVVTYLLRGPDSDFAPLIVFQALAAAFVLAVFLAGFRVGAASFWGGGATLALIIPLAWVVSFAMPDVFAALALLTVVALLFNADRMSRGVLSIVGLIGAFAVASNPSHLLLALVMTPLAGLGVWFLGRRRQASHLLMAYAWGLVPVVLGVILVIGPGVIGFREVSLAPKAPPFLLARSVGDGPGRWYLERICPTKHYVVCDLYGSNIPKTSGDFLFGPTGLQHIATPAQLTQIRSEERPIVVAATLAYPFQQLRASLGGVAQQLIHFSVREEQFNGQLVRDAEGHFDVVRKGPAPVLAVRIADRLAQMLAAISLTVCAWRLPKVPARVRIVVALLLAGVAANDVICAVLSAVTDRYGSRVIWLAPLAALITLSVQTSRRGELDETPSAKAERRLVR